MLHVKALRRPKLSSYIDICHALKSDAQKLLLCSKVLLRIEICCALNSVIYRSLSYIDIRRSWTSAVHRSPMLKGFVQLRLTCNELGHAMKSVIY